MIDPTKITNFNTTDAELQEMVLFWVCAAGKNGVTAAKSLDKLLNSVDSNVDSPMPFDRIQYIEKKFELANQMKKFGIGCFNRKAITFQSLVHSKINLRTCSVEELEKIYGIGPKTARCFLIHSRPNQRLAGLDTHILKFLKDQGHQVPRNTPTGKKYKQIEKIFLEYADKFKIPIADLDLIIWNEYRSK